MTEWNDPQDIMQVTRAFNAWTDAVIAKDRTAIEAFHDDGFRVRFGDRLFGKQEHIYIEIAVGNQEMKLTEIQATRRIGGLLLVWSMHFIRADAIPEIPELGLLGDWGNIAVAARGFDQGELSVWRTDLPDLKCIAFDIGSFQSGA